MAHHACEDVKMNSTCVRRLALIAARTPQFSVNSIAPMARESVERKGGVRARCPHPTSQTCARQARSVRICRQTSSYHGPPRGGGRGSHTIACQPELGATEGSSAAP